MIRILLVDDHLLVRDGIKWMLLGEESMEVVGEAAGGAEMLEMLDEAEPDVVLLDIRMPEMSGLEVMEVLAERTDPPRVLMLSMYDEPGLVQQAVALGAAGYLKKSAGRAELLEAIRLVAEGKSYLQGELTIPLISRLVDDNREPPRLSARDKEILQLMARGRSNRQIAEALETAEQAMQTEVHGLFGRLGVHRRSEAVAVALRLGAID